MFINPTVRIRDPFSRGLRLIALTLEGLLLSSNQRPVLKGIETIVPELIWLDDLFESETRSQGD